MVDLIYPDEARVSAVSMVVHGGVYLMLHNKPTAVSLSNTLADIVPFELANAGYSRLFVDESSLAVGLSGHLAYAIGPQRAWVNLESFNVEFTGYCVLDAAQAFILTSFYFQSPVIWKPAGSVLCTPVYTLQSRYPE